MGGSNCFSNFKRSFQNAIRKINCQNEGIPKIYITKQDYNDYNKLDACDMQAKCYGGKEYEKFK